MAVRLSQERLRLVGEDDEPQDAKDEVAALPSVRRITDSSTGSGPAEGSCGPGLHVVVPTQGDGLGGDDDEDEECTAIPGDEETVLVVDEEDYYADVWESR
jgi:hypothetical protein